MSEERDYSHRSVVDKLGIEGGMRVRMTGDLGDELRSAAKARLGASLLRSGKLDLIVRMVSSVAEADEFIERVRPRMQDHTALWLATWKKGDPRYVMQEDLMPVAFAYDLVDNKVCSIDDRRSAIRFVIPKASRSRIAPSAAK